MIVASMVASKAMTSELISASCSETLFHALV